MEEAKIIDMTEDGKGLARIEGRVFFIDGALYGDRVKFIVTGEKKKIAYGKALQILTPSPYRIKPPCPYHEACGGCPLISLSMEGQRELKIKKIKDSYERIGGLKVDKISFIENDHPINYRNKISLKVIGGKLSYYNKKSHDNIHIRECLLADERINEAIRIAQASLDRKSPPGIKEMTFRSGKGLMLIAEFEKDSLEGREFLSGLFESGKFSSLVLRTRRGGKAKDELVFGKGKLEDKIGDLNFLISPDAFFQINKYQTEKLYKAGLEKIDFKRVNEALDLYTGIGTLASFIAKDVSQVLGVDSNPQAIRDAKENASLNGIKNVSFIKARSEDIGDEIIRIKPDLVVLDPPRKGLDKRVTRALIEASPDQILYISCNPVSQARDLKIFKEGGYRISDPTGVDMFSQTLHVETLTLLSKSYSYEE